MTVAWEMGSLDWPGLCHVGVPMTGEGVSLWPGKWEVGTGGAGSCGSHVTREGVSSMDSVRDHLGRLKEGRE